MDPTRPAFKSLQISLRQLAVLLYNAAAGVKSPHIGHLEAGRSLEGFWYALDRTTLLDVKDLEAALYLANARDERGEFEHPDGLSFSQFVGQLLPSSFRFDRNVNLIYNRTKRSSKHGQAAK